MFGHFNHSKCCQSCGLPAKLGYFEITGAGLLLFLNLPDFSNSESLSIFKTEEHSFDRSVLAILQL